MEVYKLCLHCRTDKPESEYYFYNKKTGKLRPICKKCFLDREHSYLKNGYKGISSYNKIIRCRKDTGTGYKHYKIVNEKRVLYIVGEQ